MLCAIELFVMTAIFVVHTSKGQFVSFPQTSPRLDMIYASISRLREPLLDQDPAAYPPLAF